MGNNEVLEDDKLIHAFVCDQVLDDLDIPNYHLDWGILMPAIAKINEAHPKYIDAGDLSWYALQAEYKFWLTKANIENTYKAIVKAIKWFNKKNY